MGGIYLNPKDMSKEMWLYQNGTPIDDAQAETHPYVDDQLLVCWVNNGMFTAAGIAYDAQERDFMVRGIGRREHHWYIVERKDLSPWLT